MHAGRTGSMVNSAESGPHAGITVTEAEDRS